MVDKSASVGDVKRVFLLTVPQVFASGVVGAQDLLATEDHFLDRITREPERSGHRFDVHLVGTQRRVATPFGQTLDVDVLLEDAAGADIVYVPPLALVPDQPPVFEAAVLEWLSARYAEGAEVCAACTGTLLPAAAGLLDGEPATTHWAFGDLFRACYPGVDLRIERTLVAGGENHRLVTAGAHASWQDLMLYLLHRHAGAATARKVAKVFLLDWHELDQNAYAMFLAPMRHGDDVVRKAQEWLAGHLRHHNPVEAAADVCGLPKRSFLRRFRQVTGHTPLRYLQHLRVEKAKALLEDHEASVEQIAWVVGYDDPPYFRRLFKSFTGVTPADYRRSFRTPSNVKNLLENSGSR